MLCVCFWASPAWAQDYEIDAPRVALAGVPFEVLVSGGDGLGPEQLELIAAGRAHPAALHEDGGFVIAGVVVASSGAVELELRAGGVAVASATTRVIPGWIAILPPLVAIAAALISKAVIPSLFFGIWVGAFALSGFSLTGAFMGLLEAFQIYVLGALFDPDHAAIILFTFMIGGMVGIISKNGGMQGVVNRIVPLAATPKKGQAATGLLGLIIFFDDYANVLIIGNTMRQVTDRLRISREKLAYIVDSTAAPVSSVALISTWIGFEVGLIQDSVAQIDGYNETGYTIFLASIAYRFYPLLCMFFVFLVAFSGRDFGPMYDAEVRARTTGQVVSPDAKIDEAADAAEMTPADDQPKRAVNAILPIAVLLGGVLVGLYVTGSGDTLREIVGDADSYKALMWASLLGAFTAGALSLGQRILSLTEVVDAWYAGLKAMMIAMIILILAWALSAITADLHTAGYLVSVFGDWLSPALLPAAVFVLSAATAFATGSSWGTMGILMPLVLPLTWAVLQANNIADPQHYSIIYSTTAGVLAGSVWGDHCSPISDTTILSSMASGCDHIDHVRTQLPYALLVGLVGLLVGTVPTGYGVPWWVALFLAAAVLGGVHRYFGKRVDGAAPEPDNAQAQES